MNPIDPVDDRSHTPPEGQENWQESWYLLWYDPLRRAGGSYHVGLQTPRGRADVWNWTVVDDEVAGHYQSLTLPLPEEDLSDMTLGGMHLRTTEPLVGYRLGAEYPEEKVSAELSYRAFTEPFAFGLDGQGVTIGSSHFESFGRVTGSVRVGDETSKVSGWAFQDHSWGPRDWSSLRSHRWICATFSENLFFSVSTFITAEGRRASGYVYDDGFHGIVEVTFAVRVADDGHSPEGCDVRVWTVDGRGYHLTGSCGATAVNSHDGGWFATDGLCVFEMGGRLGTGLLEVSELKALAPWHEAELGLSLPGGR